MMSEISAKLVKELREKTGAGMMDCKRALTESNGDLELAIEVLRKQGLKDLSKRSGKVAAEGTIGVYAHAGDQIVGIVELNCETDFVARGDSFKEVARGIAMHITAMSPIYVSEEDVPQSVIEKEKEIMIEQLDEKQRDKADKIIPGRITKYFQEVCLLNQPYVKDDSGKKTVKDIIEELSVSCGEKVVIRRFQRFQVGEGVEKVQENLADAVAATIAGS
ncbi:MAG: translation elongation factor Ts [Bdellovibrionales bacterium]|nr:translation elongation factor Ts [Bdellovibrionales bacterium]